MSGPGEDDRLVWSSERGDLRGEDARDGGRRRPKAGRAGRSPRRGERGGVGAPPADGRVRVRREVKGRKGKGVTTVHGLPLGAEALRELAAELKRRCGSGGSVREGVIEIQGDHRDPVVAWLEARGWKVVRAGG